MTYCLNSADSIFVKENQEMGAESWVVFSSFVYPCFSPKKLDASTYLLGGPSLYYGHVRVKGWLGGMFKYLLFLTGVGGWSVKGQKHPYVI